MASRFWPASSDLSLDSSMESSSEVGESQSVSRDNPAGSSSSQLDEGGQERTADSHDHVDGIVERQQSYMRIQPDISPQQRASLFYLSLIEGRCRTQAATSLNAGRRPEDYLSEDHPEVCSLAETFFAEMRRELVSVGMIPEELVHHSVTQLRQYLKSFDTILNNIASTTQNNPSGLQNNAPVSSFFLLDRAPSASGSFDPYTALIPRNNNMSLQASTNTQRPEELPQTDLISAITIGEYVAKVHSSPFKTEYEVITELGQGGFGKVYKARDRLDCAEYAIKRINIPAATYKKLYKQGQLRRVTNEIRALAHLNHHHIVRYHTSWVEARSPQTKDDAIDDSSESSNYDDQTIVSESTEEVIGSLAGSLSNIRLGTERDLQIKERHRGRLGSVSRVSASGYFNLPVIFEESKGSVAEDVVQWTEEGTKSQEVLPLEAGGLLGSWDFSLYIKMKAYPLSMAELLIPPGRKVSLDVKEQNPQLRHCSHAAPTIRILRALLDGIEYLHRKFIVHRDLKPANIFLAFPEPGEEPTQGFLDLNDCDECHKATDIRPKPAFVCPVIGDFGLIHELGVADDQESSSAQVPFPFSAVGTDVSGKGKQKANTGTPFYLPNEVPTTEPKICQKLDVYALGVITLELSTQINTEQERRSILGLAKHGSFPPGFTSNLFAAGIQAMMCQDRDDRWDTHQVRRWLNDLAITLGL